MENENVRMASNDSDSKVHTNDDKVHMKENSSRIDEKESATSEDFSFKELQWFNIVRLIILHTGLIYSVFAFNFFENWKTNLWLYISITTAGLGVTAGAHRLWSHRSYKAKLPLRIVLFIFYASYGLTGLDDWVRDHRVHHKYTDTNADPHNSTRGFFFSHIGWMLVKRHPEVIRKTRQVDMSDVLTDPVVVFGNKYYPLLKYLLTFVIPVLVPVYGWNETWFRAILSQVFIRHVISLHFVWSVNSVAHLWGSKPYNKHINSTENKLVSIMAYGEGWHNYHHVFPWDYKTAEFGDSKLNITTIFIDFCAKCGLAYDLKQPSKDLVKHTVMKKGDGTHSLWKLVPHLETPPPVST